MESMHEIQSRATVTTLSVQSRVTFERFFIAEDKNLKAEIFLGWNNSVLSITGVVDPILSTECL